MANMKTPHVPKTLIKPFRLEELRLLLSLCDQKTFLGLRNRAIILVFLETGLRLKELANMQIEDIDFERGIIQVMGKGARERVVAIQPRTLARDLGFSLVYPKNKAHIKVTSLQELREIFEKSGSA